MKTAKAVLGGLVLALTWAAAYVIGMGIVVTIIYGAFWIASTVSVIGWIVGIIFGLLMVLIVVAVVAMAIEEVKDYGFREGIKHSFREFFRA